MTVFQNHAAHFFFLSFFVWVFLNLWGLNTELCPQDFLHFYNDADDNLHRNELVPCDFLHFRNVSDNNLHRSVRSHPHHIENIPNREDLNLSRTILDIFWIIYQLGPQDVWDFQNRAIYLDKLKHVSNSDMIDSFEIIGMKISHKCCRAKHLCENKKYTNQSVLSSRQWNSQPYLVPAERCLRFSQSCG